jgi:hypothetical protein
VDHQRLAAHVRLSARELLSSTIRTESNSLPAGTGGLPFPSRPARAEGSFCQRQLASAWAPAVTYRAAARNGRWTKPLRGSFVSC